MEKQPNSRMCFVCGIENPIGLHLHFYTDEEERCMLDSDIVLNIGVTPASCMAI